MIKSYVDHHGVMYFVGECYSDGKRGFKVEMTMPESDKIYIYQHRDNVWRRTRKASQDDLDALAEKQGWRVVQE